MPNYSIWFLRECSLVPFKFGELTLANLENLLTFNLTVLKQLISLLVNVAQIRVIWHPEL